MSNNRTIIHIDDEYQEVRGLLQFVKIALEDYSEESDNLQYYKIQKLNEEIERNENYEFYNIGCNDPDLPNVKYIFSEKPEIQELQSHDIEGDLLFIVDAMRPGEKNGDLVSILELSVKNIRKKFGNDAEILVYTAYNRAGLLGDIKGNITVHSKSHNEGVETAISEFLIGAGENNGV